MRITQMPTGMRLWAAHPTATIAFLAAMGNGDRVGLRHISHTIVNVLHAFT
jgi:hypothetical protein